ncbi:MAG: hypothetical protein AB8B69_07500 [Chitinophagales bacterium]
MSTSPTPKKALRRIEEDKRNNAKGLDLNGCGLKCIPSEIVDMVQLEKLYLDNNQI